MITPYHPLLPPHPPHTPSSQHGYWCRKHSGVCQVPFRESLGNHEPCQGKQTICRRVV